MPRLTLWKSPPFPLEVLTELPESAGLSPGAFGCLIYISLAFWRGTGEPLSDKSLHLMTYAHSHGRQWAEVRNRVLIAWRAAQPILLTVYAERRALYGRQVSRAAYARSKVRPYGKRTLNNGTEMLDQHSDLAPLMPRTDAEFVKRSNAKTVRGKPATLSDAAE